MDATSSEDGESGDEILLVKFSIRRSFLFNLEICISIILFARQKTSLDSVHPMNPQEIDLFGVEEWE